MFKFTHEWIDNIQTSEAHFSDFQCLLLICLLFTAITKHTHNVYLSIITYFLINGSYTKSLFYFFHFMGGCEK